MTSYAGPLAEVSPAERHLRIAGAFADVLAGTTDWGRLHPSTAGPRAMSSGT